MMDHDHQWNLNFVRETYDCRCGASIRRQEVVEAWPDLPFTAVSGTALTLLWDQKAEIAAALLRIQMESADALLRATHT